MAVKHGHISIFHSQEGERVFVSLFSPARRSVLDGPGLVECAAKRERRSFFLFSFFLCNCRPNRIQMALNCRQQSHI